MNAAASKTTSKSVDCRLLPTLSTPYALFTDGGLFGSNTTPEGRALGGVVAARLVEKSGAVLAEWSGVIGPKESPYVELWEAWGEEDGTGGSPEFGFLYHTGPEVSNNLAEVCAILYGLPACLWIAENRYRIGIAPAAVTVCSDSDYALGATLGNDKLDGLFVRCPKTAREAQRWRTELGHLFRKATGLLLAGHPSAAQLAEGERFSKTHQRMLPVSPHNVWCDTECNRIKAQLKAALSGPSGDALADTLAEVTAEAQPELPLAMPVPADSVGYTLPPDAIRCAAGLETKEDGTTTVVFARGDCPVCAEAGRKNPLVSNLYLIPDKGYLLVWECFAALLPVETETPCHYRRVI
jgi:ribonuclease HI